MRRSLAELPWTVTGFTPYAWSWASLGEAASDPRAEVPAVAAPVPGSVQAALRAAGLLPDWFSGLESRSCEWVENRHWIYRTEIPADWFAAHNRLVCRGLDHRGLVRLGGEEIGAFEGTFVPHEFPVEPPSGAEPVVLQIIFLEPPRRLGQLGYTSQMTDWKARFNYGWDWTSRVVQIGISDDILLESTATSGFAHVTGRSQVVAHGASASRDTGFDPASPAAGRVSVRWDVWGDAYPDDRVAIELLGPDGRSVASAAAAAGSGSAVVEAEAVSLWWPNGYGAQPLYRLRAELRDAEGTVVDSDERRVGFRHVEWKQCDGAPPGARPWICVVNGQPIFLQGVNWTPIRPTFADVSAEAMVSRLSTYREMGCTVLRVWGGATLESRSFYRACDEMGLLVWQEFPLSSSGLDNWPPEDPGAVEEMARIAASYVMRRCNHPFLLLWCGGNELQGGPKGEKAGVGRPIDETHPMISRMAEVVSALDPGRRFLPTSSSGPRFDAGPDEFGRGLHHDVHGPWALPGGSLESARRYWEQDDALFRSEVGAPGASGADIIERYGGGLPTMPASADNPLWRRSSWWIEWDEFIAAREADAGEPTLSEFVDWSATRQADALELAARAVKRRFPRAGGFIVWMGHDCFPCTANTAVLDFNGRMKPAAHALARVFHTPSNEL